MPLYDIQHSYPLSQPQKQSIAESITKIHSEAFLTPSFFVHVTFKATDASDGNYFLAGKPATGATNRILAQVRTGPSRSKKDFDDVAAKIEDAWIDAVSGPVLEDGKDAGQRKLDVDKGQVAIKAKKLVVISFYNMVAARENGHVIPSAGDEAAWFKELKPEFQKQADAGDEQYKDFLEEVENREDLKKAYIGSSWFSK